MNPKKSRKNTQLTDLLYKLARSEEYMDAHYYPGELGAIYSRESTQFKLWAPTASQVELIIYDGYYGQAKESVVMEWDEKNKIYYTKIKGDCHGLTYRYRLVFFDGSVNLSQDPYSKATTVNGQRSVVVDLKRTNPDNWSSQRLDLPDLTQTVIYEVSVRDLSSSPTSGTNNKGTFLAAGQKNTSNRAGSPTVIDYIKELGVSHVQFMPIFDFQTVDESWEEPREYNWGYDPLNYNVPEGSYATDSYDPFCRIRQLKTMIQAYHDAGLGVIMDVVYNHVYEVENHPLHKCVPGYYFRYDEEGNLTNSTGVGNDTNSENLMMRKYIVDSVVYWAREYNIDGFRFDLMGVHDVQTMKEVRKALDEVDPSIIIIGEGWDMYQPEEGEASNIYNASKLDRIGFFNPGLREAIKGNDFEVKSRGFINGAWYMEGDLVNNFLGGIDYDYIKNPLQMVQYIECHDNHTLYDRLHLTDPYLDEYTLLKQHELATTIVLLSQGIPFIHCGQEFMRSKKMQRNTYNMSDEVNQIDWTLQDKYTRSVRLVKDLISLRKSEPMFRLETFEEIKRVVQVVRSDYQIVQLRYQGDEYDLDLVFNAQKNVLNVPLEPGEYIVKLINGRVYLDDDHKIIINETVAVESYTTLLLKRVKNSSDYE